MQQKAVLKLDLHDDKDKKKAMKIVSGFAGIDSILISLKDGKLTVTGDFDPVQLVEKLRKKLFPTNLESVGPVKDEKNNGNEKGEEKKKNNDSGGAVEKVFPIPITYYQPYPYTPRPWSYYDQHRSVEEDPNGCVIC